MRAWNSWSTARRFAPIRSSASISRNSAARFGSRGLELLGHRRERPLEGEAGLEAHHREVEGVGKGGRHPPQAPRGDGAKPVLRHDAADEETGERREGDDYAVPPEHLGVRGEVAGPGRERRPGAELDGEEVREGVALPEPRPPEHCGELLAFPGPDRGQHRGSPEEREAKRPGARTGPAAPAVVLAPRGDRERPRPRHPEPAVEGEAAPGLAEDGDAEHGEDRGARDGPREDEASRDWDIASLPSARSAGRPGGDRARGEDPGHDEPDPPPEQGDALLGAEQDLDRLRGGEPLRDEDDDRHRGQHDQGKAGLRGGGVGLEGGPAPLAEGLGEVPEGGRDPAPPLAAGGG